MQTVYLKNGQQRRYHFYYQLSCGPQPLAWFQILSLESKFPMTAHSMSQGPKESGQDVNELLPDSKNVKEIAEQDREANLKVLHCSTHKN